VCRYSLRRAAGGHVSTAARRINPLFYTATAQPSRGVSVCERETDGVVNAYDPAVDLATR